MGRLALEPGVRHNTSQDYDVRRGTGGKWVSLDHHGSFIGRWNGKSSSKA